MNISKFIRGKAQELGFVAAGFATAAPAVSWPHLEKWLADGRAGDMHFMSRTADLRRHPNQVLPEARSLIMLAARYAPQSDPAGFWAGYARVPDYHDVLRARLRRLAEVSRPHFKSGTHFRICIDSAPLLEREWAMRAGLGWRGRQGCLVHPQWGCGLFLAAIIINADLPAPEGHRETAAGCVPDQCGNCRRCLDACPNAAIGADGMVDARRCAAYLTVEHRDVIPRDWAPRVGGSLFGCDRCTAVCPRNPADNTGIITEFQAAAFTDITPADCLNLTQSEFTRVFQGTPVKRLGLERLQRNAVIVLHNARRSGAWRPPAGIKLAPLASSQMDELS